VAKRLATDKPVRLKMVVLEYNLAVKRVMLTVPDPLDKRNALLQQPRTLTVH
jgi:hypothetical protein